MDSSKMIEIISDGIPFLVRIVAQGDKHGHNNCITHLSSAPIVEFYDRRFKHTEFGQFASNYYMSTLLDRHETVGLCLHGGVPDWSINAECMKKVLKWLEEFKEHETV